MTAEPARRHKTQRTTVSAVAAALALLWAVLAAVHPPYFSELADPADMGVWMLVHYIQLLLAPLVALAVLHLLIGVEGVAATVARVAVVVWAAWFSAFDAIAGIASGVLVEEGAAEAGRVLFDHGLVGGAGSVLGWLGQSIWPVVAIAAGLALRNAGAHRATFVAMFVSVLIAAHAGPAAVGFVALAVALWTGRTRTAQLF